MSSTTGRVLGAYGAPPAPLGRRVAAWLVDGLGTALCAAPIWVANLAVLTTTLSAAEDAFAAGAETMTVPASATPDPVLVAVGAVLLLVWGGVQWWFHGTRGWTLGKRLLQIRTVDVRTGRPIGLGRAFVRYLVVALSVLACGVGQVVVLLSPLFDRTGRYRGWHDRVGEAVVVDVRGLAASRRVSGWDDPARRPAESVTAPVGATPPVGVPGGADDDLDAGQPTWSALAPASEPVPAPPAAPDAPDRTRWSQLAADRRLDGPGLVLPPLGTPGPGPDLDTRQLPVVPAAGAFPQAGPGVPVPPASALPAAGAWPPPAPAHPGTPTPASALPAVPSGATWPPPAPGPVPGPVPGPTPQAPAPDTAGAWPPPAPQPHAPGSSAAWPTPAPEHEAAPWPAAHPAAPHAAPAPEADAWDRAGRHADRPGAPVHPDAPAPVPWQSVAPAPAPPPAPEPAPAPAPAWGHAAPPVPDPAPLPAEVFPAPAHAPAARPTPPAYGTAPTGAAAPDAAPAWWVRLPDGTPAPLDVPLLVGRNPDPLPGTRVAPVADPSRSVSKTHLLLGVDEQGPWVLDRGSTNGTLVTLGDGQRIVAMPDRRVRLTDGSLVAFGDLSLSVGVRA